MSNFNTTTETQALPQTGVRSYLIAFIAFFTMILCMVGLAECSRITAGQLDFNNLLNAGKGATLRLLLIAAAPVALFLLFQSLVRWVHTWDLSVTMRAVFLLVAAFAAYAVGMLLLPDAAQDGLALAVAGGLVIAVVFDFATARKQTDFGWTILAFLLFSAFSSAILWTTNTSNDRHERFAYAEALANTRDTAQAEQLFVQLNQTIQQDAQLPFLLKAWPIKPSADSVRNYLSKLAYQQKYLFRNYSLTTYAFDRGEEAPLLLDQFDARSKVLQQWDQSQPVSGNENLRSGYASDGTFRYILRSKINRMENEGRTVELYCFFTQVFPQQSEVYSQVFENQEFKNLSNLSKYDFSLFNGERQVVEQGRIAAASFNTAVNNGQTVEADVAGRSDAVSKSADGKMRAIVGREAPGVLQPVYLFSILFTFATAFLLLIGILARFLPFNMTLLPSVKGSLGRRIHFSYLGLLAAGFMVVGVITYRHFSRTALETEQHNAEQRTNAALTYLRLSSANLAPGTDSVRTVLGPRLVEFAKSLNIDADLFDANGKMVYSTREDLRRIGVLPTLMAAKGTESSVVVMSKLENTSFPVRYLPVLNSLRVPVGYIGLPYRLNESQVSPEVSEFIGILASIYVFLLLVAAVVTGLVSNTITKPLNAIADKIKDVELEDINQPLTYAGDPDDEISGLVNEYNRMVDKLEKSKVVLVKLERESAWRDMARQIAHDIKNPLTTMKLSMQQLERVSNDPERAIAYMKKTTGRLIEQIDSLAQTASEFSMFASLDRTPRNPVVINDLVESVFDLFTEQKEVDLQLDLPAESYTVNADKNHLLRVLNNLVINAIQAIPSDRKGKVKVALERQGDFAVIRISDNGGGIPIEIRDRVFEPNFTTKTSGSGLGLAICKKIIEAHDGDIRFKTWDNEGTEFFVELPVV
jgi:signal transduction histidine kinase